jgi:hypothetical protein
MIDAWQEAACDLADVTEWWTRSTRSGIAFRLDGLIVLDLDMHDGSNGFESLATLEQQHGAVLEARLKTAHWWQR